MGQRTISIALVVAVACSAGPLLPAQTFEINQPSKQNAKKGKKGKKGPGKLLKIKQLQALQAEMGDELRLN